MIAILRAGNYSRLLPFISSTVELVPFKGQIVFEPGERLPRAVLVEDFLHLIAEISSIFFQEWFLGPDVKSWLNSAMLVR